jgi:hypothetical protein
MKVFGEQREQVTLSRIQVKEGFMAEETLVVGLKGQAGQTDSWRLQEEGLSMYIKAQRPVFLESIMLLVDYSVV